MIHFHESAPSTGLGFDPERSRRIEPVPGTTLQHRAGLRVRRSGPSAGSRPKTGQDFVAIESNATQLEHTPLRLSTEPPQPSRRLFDSVPGTGCTHDKSSNSGGIHICHSDLPSRPPLRLKDRLCCRFQREIGCDDVVNHRVPKNWWTVRV